MGKNNTKEIRTAKKYSEALYDVGERQGKISDINTDLKFVAQTINSNEELENFFKNPVITLNDKKDVINQLFREKINETTINFLYILVDNGRIEILTIIADEFEKLIKEKTGITVVKAISAVEIKGYLKEKLENKIEQMIGKKVQIEYEIKPEIIAGLIVEIEGKTLDNSIRTRIKNIKKQLI